jgi:hypothetical protein
MIEIADSDYSRRHNVPEPLTLQFKYDEKEYARAVRHHFSITMHVRLDLFVSVLLIGAGIFLRFYRDWDDLILLPIILGVIMLVGEGCILFILPHRWYKIQPKLREEYKLVFSDAGIVFQTAGVDSKLEWSIYNKWLSFKDFYLLYYGKGAMSIIPRRAFASREDDQTFRDLLIKHIGNPRSERN